MVIFQAQMSLPPARRRQVIGALTGILNQTRESPGCLSCRLCADVEDDSGLVLIEQWADMHSLRVHVCAEAFRIVLSALECASTSPDVRFDSVADTKGMGFVIACRHGLAND